MELLCHYEEFHPARVSFLESLSSILVIMKGYEKCIIVFAALTLRYVISLNYYSGQGKPPMFGDMEAQRHWMEITTNLAVNDWYRNTTDNDLMYWGLDYPPLTAYHEKIMGVIAKWLIPKMVTLHSSRGIETDASILFMRLSVIISDCIVYIPACFLFVHYCIPSNKLPTLLVLLLNPPLLLIDHGHFQYNSVCLGLTLLAITCIHMDWDCLGSIFFVLAIGYKQIALYYSLVFFVWLLKKCYMKHSLAHLLQIGSTVLLTFIVLFLPFLLTSSPIGSVVHVIHRMFPWARGLFEDKVASFWCTLNNVVKINRLFSQGQLKVLCLIFTLLFLIIPLYFVWKDCRLESVCIALFLCSLSFFLFSYQVHEKTILFPLLPMMLLTNQYPELTKWFVYYASYSMIPLYIKDINLIQAIALMFGYLILCPPQSFTKPIPCIGFVVSLVILCYYYMDPPLRYPDLHSVLISSFSCFVFCVFYCIMMVQQYRVVYHSELVEKKRDYFCLFPFIIILMNTLRIIPKLSIVAKRCFSESTVVKIVADEAPKVVSTAQNTTIKVEESVKPAKETPKAEKQEPKKKKSGFRPFLYGCVCTVIVGYFFVYNQIWKSAHQMEQSIADISVDVSENVDHLEQRVARLESLQE